ncbi:FecR family protein [Pedobacter mendelii]|uniref:Iron dicitrate transporter FecR n=1 Tax=Pedobacter mendelii TaxID=1908240 RepID=A0ABQ2BI96_9SPHI|nr:FecR family protein [Pedobacter mendelii]GGI25284.1 iron dicitrate transporter FecR [Pedobacter mendelii]
MTLSKERLQELVKLQFERTISAVEKEELFNYVLDPLYAEELLAKLPDVLSIDLTDEDLNETQKENVLSYIFKYGHIKKTIPYRAKFWPRIIAAASVILVVGIGFYFYRSYDEKEKQTIYAYDANPGINSATLTLGNGQKILLSNAATGKLAEQQGVIITKSLKGELIYTIKNVGTERPEFNTMSTANGQQYIVNLPDGSKVWLNAASSLTYPSTFASLKKRYVTLKGEGYFEITKDKAHPFVVKTDNQTVEVLGTHFNINSYKDEPNVKTTLLEGGVKIKSGLRTEILNPGQQGIVSLEENNIVTKQADIQEVLAWKNGDFIFNGVDIKNIMFSLSRWYDVEIKYEGTVTKELYYGKISRSKNLSSVLKMLQKAGGAHLRIEGRRIIVMQ